MEVAYLMQEKFAIYSILDFSLLMFVEIMDSENTK